MNQAEVKTKTDAELLESLANATETYYSCGGHHKADMNKLFIKWYKEELIERKIEIPELTVLLDKGVFNGAGSY